MRSLCFTTYVHGWYQDFIPIYIFSILHQFPNYFVKIFTHEKLTVNNSAALDLVKSFNSSFKIVERYQGVDCTNIKHLPAVRYLLPKSEFSGFDYVYFGDVDFIVTNEHNDDFVTYYKKQCDYTNLPFSNAITHDNNKHRMTGLHFIETKPYYERIEPEIQNIIDGDPFALSIIDSFSFDEEVLYYMNSRVFDLSSLEGYTRPHNGVHLGYCRERADGHSYSGKTKLKDWNQQKDKITSIIDHRVFKQLLVFMGDRAKLVFDKAYNVLYRPMFL